MAWSQDSSTLFLGTNNGDLEMNWPTKQIIQLEPSDGNFFYEVLANLVYGFHQLSGNVFAAAYNNGSVYALNMKHHIAFTVCIGVGSTSNCTFPIITGLLATSDGTIYLGLPGKIQMLSGRLRFSSYYM